MGKKQIADHLEYKGIPTPNEYYRSNGLKTRGAARSEPVKWSTTTVNAILSHQEYIGDIINFKTQRKSYKNHDKITVPEENRAVFKGVNEPIISQ